MKLFKFIVAGLLPVVMSGCGTMSNYTAPVKEVVLEPYQGTLGDSFANLDKSVAVRVSYMEEQDENIKKIAIFNNPLLTTGYSTQYVPGISTFAKSTIEEYMMKMGFELSSSANYVLDLKIRTFEFVKATKNTVDYNVVLSYALLNEAGEMIVPTNTTNGYVTLDKEVRSGVGLGQAYYEAVKKINWNRIAKVLTVQKSAKQEKNAKVQGKGDTALEHSVIRWNISSRPQGADVSWRVISSTPDVANTNSNYVGTTPYESTESFDIKGLTYNNSGNVQIEVTCERPGYLPQKRRFNLRQAIDQKEISAMFNLIKDE